MVSFRDPGKTDAERGGANPADGSNSAGNAGGSEKIAPVTYLRGAGHTPDIAASAAPSSAESWFGSEPESGSGSASRPGEPGGSGSGAPVRQRRTATASHLRAVGGAGDAESADDADVEAPEPIADPEAVETLLVRKLARRALSEAEVLAFAVQEGLTAAQANSILDRLRELGYVDDRALAEQLKHALSERKGQSKAVVARAMSGRSIDRDIISEVLDDIEQEDELGVATELARKRASQMSGLDKQTLERRLTGFLARRGYPGQIVREAIAPVLTGRASAPSSTVRFR